MSYSLLYPFYGDLFSEKLKAGIDEAVADAQQDVNVPVDGDTEPLKAKVDELKLRIDILKAQRNDVEIGADATRAELELAVLDAELRELEKPAKVMRRMPAALAMPCPVMVRVRGGA